MEVQIQDLVDSIKKQGIDAANAEAEKILSDAKKKADEIISCAKSEAAAEKDSAEKEIGLMKSRAELSADQAKRDAMLSFKAEVRACYEKLLQKDVSSVLSGDSLPALIRAALQGEDISAYSVELASVSEGLQSALAEEIRAGLEIRPGKFSRSGFRLAAKDASGYFDCTDEEIMKMLMPYFRNLDF